MGVSPQILDVEDESEQLGDLRLVSIESLDFTLLDELVPHLQQDGVTLHKHDPPFGVLRLSYFLFHHFQGLEPFLLYQTPSVCLEELQFGLDFILDVSLDLGMLEPFPQSLHVLRKLFRFHCWFLGD